jgi:restriction system protein
MPVPDFQSITLPLLRLSAAGEIRTREAVNALADEFELTPDEREELLPSGRQARFSNRVHWAIVYLQKGGLIQRIARGVYRITEPGKTVLLQPPQRIDRRFLAQFEGVKEFRKKKTKDEAAESDLVNALPAGTPEERIESALEDLNEALREDLLERILSMPPTAFEKLIIDLMLGMGYGADGSGKHLGRTADGGVDGIINEDVLGLDIIYLQAKRYAIGNSIGVEKIREFAGALDERGATKGVFVTTSHFALPARQYAERSPKRLILIDGDELTHYLIKFGVAVRGYQTVVLKKLDVDYFDDLDS